MKKIALFFFVLVAVINAPSFVFASEKSEGEEFLLQYKKVIENVFVEGSEEQKQLQEVPSYSNHGFNIDRSALSSGYESLKSDRIYIQNNEKIVLEKDRPLTEKEKDERSELFLDRLPAKEKFLLKKIFFDPLFALQNIDGGWSIIKNDNKDLPQHKKKQIFFDELLRVLPPEIFPSDDLLLSEEITKKKELIKEYEDFLNGKTLLFKVPDPVIKEEKAYYELLKWHWAQWEKYGTFTNLLDGTVYKFLSFEQMDQMQKEKEEIQRQKYEKERAEKKAKEAGKEYELVFTGNDIVLKEKNSFWSIALWIILISLVAIGGFLYYRKRTTRPKNNDQF